MKTNKLAIAFVVLLFCFSSAQSTSAEPTLFDNLQDKDDMMFSQGFDNCDLSITASLMTDDVEFYHDKGGVDKGKKAFLETMRDGLCRTGKNEIRRHLVPNSLAVFPMHNNGILYGAIQTGKHGFAPSGEEVTIAPASFIHLWLLEDDGEWRIARVLSYDHQ